ncbi:hypothetical protein CH330_06765, partial [candidate division WOR-3 bacterium JGI_Cruoil_03_51_56]
QDSIGRNWNCQDKLKEVAIWKQLFSLLGRTDNRKIGLTGIENKLQSAVELMGYSLTLLKKNG